MHQKCNVPIALPSVLIIEKGMRAVHCVCLTSELEMGCMVPCSREGVGGLYKLQRKKKKKSGGSEKEIGREGKEERDRGRILLMLFTTQSSCKPLVMCMHVCV